MYSVPLYNVFRKFAKEFVEENTDPLFHLDIEVNLNCLSSIFNFKTTIITF